MNKTAIKNYAVWARNELKELVTQRAYEYEVTADSVPSYNTVSVHGRLLTDEEKKQLNELITEVKKNGVDHVVEEVAYTWFNRFIALRYMEVNNYLPQRVRVFTNENNEFKPELLTEAIHIELDGLDKQKVFDYIEQNNQEGLYKYLLLTICNDMNQYLPDMFTSISDYKTLLMPNNLLKEDGVLAKLISDIDEDSWNDRVQIIGWLYQYYIQMPKDELIHAKKQYKSDDVPFVTQLFTPDWVVRYMVENSLGNYYLKMNPNTELYKNWKYFIKNNSTKEIKRKKLEDIKVIDPCMGSGHILVYAFDLLISFYEEFGYSSRDAAVLILENNLYGFDIDQRAYQLSYFALMMKARSYNRRILTQNIRPNIYCIEDKIFAEDFIESVSNGNNSVQNTLKHINSIYSNSNVYGSLLDVTNLDKEELESLKDYLDSYVKQDTNDLLSILNKEIVKDGVQPIIQCSLALKQKYDCVITNPPYLNSSLMPKELKDFLNKNYSDCKSDIFAAFIKKCIKFTSENGYVGMITPYVWMFISSYEKLRGYLLNNTNISSMIQLEYNAFEAACVPVATFILHNTDERYKGNYIKLSDFKGADNQAPKTIEAINNHECGYYYETSSEAFNKIPGSPIAYWCNEKVISIFNKEEKLGDIASPRKGNSTSDNNRFLRLWFEVNKNHLNIDAKEIKRDESKIKRWYPYNKGGDYRRWYGNKCYVIDWYDDAKEIRSIKTAVIANYQYFCKPGLTWSTISSGSFSIRKFGYGFIFDNGGCCIFDLEDKGDYLLALLNSNVLKYILGLLSPTLNYQSGEIAKFPVIYQKNIHIDQLSIENTVLSKSDWDSFETSWDFKAHPLVKNHVSTISEAYSLWDKECNDRFNQLKTNEEELNRIFIDIYGLQDELDPYVEDKDVTVRKADIVRDIKSFISYAVGCMFGRYSLEKAGLVFAGGNFDDVYWKHQGFAGYDRNGHLPLGSGSAGISLAKVHYPLLRDNEDVTKATKLSYEPDVDDIMPICDEEYFEDDIVSRFVEFVRCVYGEDTLEENLRFIADALGGKGNPREVLRNYFLNDFFKDHCNTYQVTGSGKRPIYWLFDSGKKNGFKALVYIHRYTPDLIARMRTGYIHPLQSQYRTQIEMLNNQIDEAVSTSEKVKLQKQLKKINEQLTELSKYEEIVHHWADKMEPMDLDDGVKTNYVKFQELLSKIK